MRLAETILVTPGSSYVVAETLGTSPEYVRSVRMRAWRAAKDGVSAEIERELGVATDPDVIAFLGELMARNEEARRHQEVHTPRKQFRPSDWGTLNYRKRRKDARKSRRSPRPTNKPEHQTVEV